MSKLNRQAPRPRATRHRPSYPRSLGACALSAVGLGAIALVAACTNEVDVEGGGDDTSTVTSTETGWGGGPMGVAAGGYEGPGGTGGTGGAGGAGGSVGGGQSGGGGAGGGGGGYGWGGGLDGGAPEPFEGS